MSIVSTIIFVSLSLDINVVAYKEGIPKFGCAVIEKADGAHVDCSSRDLTYIPPLPKSAVSIDLSHNRINTIMLVMPFQGFCGSDPTGIKVTTKRARSVHVTWDTTNTNCGYTITGYRVYFNSISPVQLYKSKDVTGASTDNVEIFPIFPEFTYKIYVKALTASGEVSNPSSITYSHPHAKPSTAPSNIHASSKEPTKLSIVWDGLTPFTKNGIIKGYQVYYRGPGLKGNIRKYILGESNRQVTLSGLLPNSSYQFVIAAVNDVGPGRFSNFLSISTPPLPTTTTSTTTPPITTSKAATTLSSIATPSSYSVTTRKWTISPSTLKTTGTATVSLSKAMFTIYNVRKRCIGMDIIQDIFLIYSGEHRIKSKIAQIVGPVVGIVGTVIVAVLIVYLVFSVKKRSNQHRRIFTTETNVQKEI